MAGIYIHIPFCKKKCSYCAFFSAASTKRMREIVDCISRELHDRRAYLQTEKIETIYFGGGTPSLLEEAEFEKMFNAINEDYDLTTCTEITMEANPDDLTPEYVRMIASLPFNRISIGVQSLHDKQLKAINRRHSAQQAIDCIKQCADAGFENISADLMYGFPNETLEELEEDLDGFLRLGVQHISAYCLSFEEGTALFNLRQKGKIKELDERVSEEMYHTVVNRLKEGGFDHYEISNFSRQGFESKHNKSYWEGKKYIGVGPAAHSFDGMSRQWNAASLDKYIDGVLHGNPYFEKEILTEQDRYNDLVMTSLRTMKGVNLQTIEKNFGKCRATNCLMDAESYIRQGKLAIDNNHLHLTENGVFVSDSIISNLFWVDGTKKD